MGSRTLSPRTLHEGEWSLEGGIRWQASENFSRAEIEEETLAGHDAHGADGLLELVAGASHGVTDRLTLSVSIPYVVTRGFRGAEENETPPPDVLVVEADTIQGLGDASLLGKYALLFDPLEFSVLGGVKIPTGETSEEDDEGERLEPDHQPGSGSWDALLGVAVGRQLERLFVSGSLFARLTTEGRRDFKPGSSFLAGVRAEYQVTDLGTFPRFSGLLEATGEYFAKDRLDGDVNGDSGGVILSVAPGAKLRLDSHLTFGLSIPVPVYQGLHGFQHEDRVGLLFGISYDF